MGLERTLLLWLAIVVATFAGAGDYSSAGAFSDGFTAAIVVSAGLSLAGAVCAAALPARGAATVAAMPAAEAAR